MTVKELAKKMNISVRTLHYYDEIGLLIPQEKSEAGYRYYSEESVRKLQQIILFKEIGMNLKQIKSVVLSDDYNVSNVLGSQKKMLYLKKDRIEHLVSQIEKIENDEYEDCSFDFSEQSWELLWNEVYNNQGEVQSEVLQPVKDFVEKIVYEKMTKVLDLGCGTGRNAIYMAKHGLKVTATDISDKGLEMTRKKAAKLELDIKIANHDMRNIPYKDGTFDAVLCSWVSGHGLKEDMVLHAREMLRVVRPGGLIFVDYVSKDDHYYGLGQEIEKDTFVGAMPGEEKMPHHYTDKAELEDLYEGYFLDINPYTYYFFDGQKDQALEANIVVIRR